MTGLVLRPQRCGHGYMKVHLGRRRQVRVHRLVCEAFHGPPPEVTYHADHIDTDPTNNAATNLRWLSPSMNLARRVFRTRDGWVRQGDEPAPDDYAPMSDAERAAADEAMAANGW